MSANRRAGFSLIEVAVCLAILAILSVSALPAAARIGSGRGPTGAVAALNGLVHRCRSNALRRGEQVDLTIDSAATFFWLRGVTSDVIIVADELPSSARGALRLHHGRHTIRCDGTGLTSGDTLLVDVGGRQEAVAVDLQTGSGHAVP